LICPEIEISFVPGRGLGADLGVLGAAHLEDDRDVHQRLDVVDQRRPW
jgi:hypothetical protein